MLLNLVQRAMVLAILGYLGYALLIFLLQRQILYPGRYLRVPREVRPAGVEAISLAGPDGPLDAWFLPSLEHIPGQRCPLLIFFHGNGEVIDLLPPQMEEFRKMGLGVLLVEYPGYGRSAGRPNERTLTAAALAAYDAVIAHPEVDPAQVVIYGRSLGGGPACALAARRPSKALILQSIFTSTRPFARQFFLPGFLVLDHFDNAAVVAAYRQPILLLHGSLDSTVPVEHSRKMKELSPGARLVEFRCDHNDFPSDWDSYYQVVKRFLREAGIAIAVAGSPKQK